jgi:NADH-quinone oxidoreductase subunit J
MMEWMKSHPMAIAGLVLWCIGLLWMMPGRRGGGARTPRSGLLVTAVGVLAFCFSCGRPHGELANEVMFWLFGAGALLCGGLMITSRNPVYGALWFALATLSTCGLFLLQQAPFLAAATIIVYAGAVIVTFLFVIMLAQQSGAAGYDQKSRQSLLATLSAFVLLGAICLTLQMSDAGPQAAPLAAVQTMDGPNPLSKASAEYPVGGMQALGRSLFGDYLFAVEIAGTLLLVACIGAIAVAPRREEGAL